MSDAAQAFLALTKQSGKLDPSAVENAYNALPAISSPESILGEWKGGSFDTGHPGHKSLVEMKWAGKTFHDVDNVDPIMVYDDEGKRVWSESYGHARLRETRFRGVVSTAMVYDIQPIIDHFRFVDENTIAGAMDVKRAQAGDNSTYYFYLTRLTSKL